MLLLEVQHLLVDSLEICGLVEAGGGGVFVNGEWESRTKVQQLVGVTQIHGFGVVCSRGQVFDAIREGTNPSSGTQTQSGLGKASKQHGDVENLPDHSNFEWSGNSPHLDFHSKLFSNPL